MELGCTCGSAWEDTLASCTIMKHERRTENTSCLKKITWLSATLRNSTCLVMTSACKARAWCCANTMEMIVTTSSNDYLAIPLRPLLRLSLPNQETGIRRRKEVVSLISSFPLVQTPERFNLKYNPYIHLQGPPVEFRPRLELPVMAPRGHRSHRCVPGISCLQEIAIPMPVPKKPSGPARIPYNPTAPVDTLREYTRRWDKEPEQLKFDDGSCQW